MISEVIDKSNEKTDEDTLSLKSNKTPTNSSVKKKMKSLKDSFRDAMKKIQLSPGTTEPKADANGNDVASPPVLSPSDSTKRGVSSRRSLPFSTKSRHPPLESVSSEEKNEEKLEETWEEVVHEEVEETYTLPELPHTPLSVMQINNLIEKDLLEDAHLNLLALRQEFQQEQERCGDNSPMELTKKEKDLSLLYGNLRNKLKALVRDSNSLPSRNKELLLTVARIIQEEEKRAEEPGALGGSWMESWKEAVGEAVQGKVESVPLEQRQQNSSWLAVHLGLLGKAILEDLQNVKRVLRSSYPPSFNIFSTYVKSYHRVVGQHLKSLKEEVTELKDLYHLLDWIINKYNSEKIMGSPSLEPLMKNENTALQLDEDFLKQLKEKYCCRVSEDLRYSLDKVTELEYDSVWKNSETPTKEEDFLDSPLHMDIWTNVKGIVRNSQKIDAQLEKRVISSCLEELKQFPKRFEMEFRNHCSALRPQPLWTLYNITYINSFTALQQHMDEYQDVCPNEVEGFRKEVKWLIVRLVQDPEDQFKEDVAPYLQRMMTRKWLINDGDFDQLYSRTKLLSEHYAMMRPPHVQESANRLHYYVVKEYIGQLMTNSYSCRNRKHEKAAAKIHQQWGKLGELFENMKSTHEWLYPVGDELSDIIGQKNKRDIKDHLEPLVEHYPDFSRKHLVAVLTFRGLLRGREYRLILQRLAELKKNLGSVGGDKSRILFDNMQVAVRTDCLSILPFSCLDVLLPHN
ncbi:exocyst complex component 3-like protein 4 [Mastacembelus armatus]|nr:exocyst complex component 3-like protein 4 [Mastacembelus armatus]